MSSPDDFPYSVAQQKALISSDLNSTLLYLFLFGNYTGLFPATIYIYIHKENRTPAKDKIIIGSTTVLYFITTLNTVVNWFYPNILFGTYNGTRAKMFLESVHQDIPLAEHIIVTLATFVVFVFTDSLLVWRCFHSCGRSFHRSLLPIALLIVETVLVLTAMVYSLLINAKPNFSTTQNDQILDRLAAATFVAVAATSLVSTIVICLQIWRHTAHISHSRKHYQTIINALIESSAMYTISVLFLAALNFIPSGEVESSLTIILLTKLVDPVTLIISGLAPTLMIARLGLSSGQEDIETSSASQPSGLISYASHATGSNTTNIGADLEMQQGGSIGVGKEESEEIQAVSRNEYYKPDSDVEVGLKTVS